MADHRQQVRGVRPDRTYVRLALRAALAVTATWAVTPSAGTAPARRRARRVTGCREVRPGWLDTWVGAAAAGCALATLAWWAGTFTLAVAAQVRQTIRSGRSAAPARAAARPPSGTLVRRLAAAALGVALGAGPVPAYAAVDRTGRRPHSEGGGRARPARPSTVRPSDRGGGAAQAPSGRWPQHDRGRGDRPEPRAVAAAWPRWWHANRAVVGPDPDLIRPGQVLHPPPSPRRTDDRDPAPLTRPPHLLPALSWEPPYDDELDLETRSRRATANAHGQGHDHGPAGVRSRRSRALWRSRSCCRAVCPRSLSRPLRTCGSCPAPTGRPGAYGRAAADRTSTTWAAADPTSPPA